MIYNFLIFNRNFMKRNLAILIFIILSACIPIRSKIVERTEFKASKQGLVPKIYETEDFKIFTLQKITDPKENLRIYFEGDGKVFIGRNIISPDPTPTSYFLTDLILQDQSPNIVYIARPCQYVEDDKCHQFDSEEYWTSKRFSQQALNSTNAIVDKFSKFKLELVGYSGGAVFAQYVAALNQKQHHNIINIRTIAGNLDINKYSEIHKAKKIESPINNQEILELLQNIPQVHFVGNEDEIIPQIVANSYLEKLPKKSCIKILEIEKANHEKGWKERWQELLAINPICSKAIENRKNKRTKS